MRTSTKTTQYEGVEPQQTTNIKVVGNPPSSKVYSIFHTLETQLQPSDTQLAKQVKQLTVNNLTQLKALMESEKSLIERFPQIYQEVKACRATLDKAVHEVNAYVSLAIGVAQDFPKSKSEKEKLKALEDTYIEEFLKEIKEKWTTAKFSKLMKECQLGALAYNRYYYQLAATRLPWIVSQLGWERRYAPNLKFEASQGFHPALIEGKALGMCFASSTKVHAYFLKHQTDKGLKKYLLDTGNKIAKDPRGRYFSEKELEIQRESSGKTAPDPKNSKANVLGPEGLKHFGITQLKVVYKSARNLKDNDETAYEKFAETTLKQLRKHKTLVFGALPRKGYGHAIEIDYYKNTYGIWDPNRGRYTFSDQNNFREAVIGILKEYENANLHLLKSSLG